jgi:hypothetical protein
MAEGLTLQAELVAVTRRVVAGEPENLSSAVQLANHLELYGNILCGLRVPKEEEACAAFAESVEVTRRLYDKNPDTYRSDLIQRLVRYGNCLETIILLEEAAAAKTEAAELESLHLA